MKFKNLEKYELETEYVKFRIPHIEENITLFLLPATQANKPFFNAQLIYFKEHGIKKPTISLSVLDETRDRERNLYARYVIKGWDGVESEYGSPVVFNIEDCQEFLTQLPDWLFDEIRMFASEPSNFVKRQESPADVAGNS